MLRVKAVRPPAGAFCPICQSVVSTTKFMAQLPCKHCFHFACYRQWKARSDTCPVCRRNHFFQFYHAPYPTNHRYFPTMFNRVLSELRYCVRKGFERVVPEKVLEKARQYMARQDQRRYYKVRYRSNTYVKLKVK